MNPILPAEFLIPDAEAHVMPDGRLYIYGSQDKYEKDQWCSTEYRVFSCGDPKLESWTDHGVSFQNRSEDGQVYWRRGKRLYAPDAIHKDGCYYLYFCGSGGYEGVAAAGRPEGPFADVSPMAVADGDGIDPAVFVDEDGSAYYLWGQYELRGAKLKDDMRTIDTATINRCLLSEPEHGFHEGASLRKRNGKYYLVYCDTSRGKATCLSYAVSDHPLGPYKKGGVIIDNALCEQETWNNHGSIECFHGQWYVFYHRACNGTKYWRRVCAEPIFFDESGHIKEVEMTSTGAAEPLDARKPIPAACACRMYRDVYIRMEYHDGKMMQWLAGAGEHGRMKMWAEYKYLDFHDGVSHCTIEAKGNCTVQLRTLGNQICGSCELKSGDVTTYTFAVSGLSGVMPVWFDFTDGDFELRSFRFSVDQR